MNNSAIYKYVINPAEIRADNTFCISCPPRTQILTVQHQSWINQTCIWAVINKDFVSETPVIRKFQLVGTGWPFDSQNRVYLGTVQLPDSELVFHYFEVIEAH